MSEPGTAAAGRAGGRGAGDAASRSPRGYALAQKAGGIVAPLLTALARVPDRRPRRARHDGHEPAHDLPARSSTAPASTGSSPGSRRRPGDELAALNLAADADHSRRRSILTGLAVAFAFRCGMFNIGGQGQYLAGAIVAVWIGSSLRRA